MSSPSQIPSASSTTYSHPTSDPSQSKSLEEMKTRYKSLADLLQLTNRTIIEQAEKNLDPEANSQASRSFEAQLLVVKVQKMRRIAGEMKVLNDKIQILAEKGLAKKTATKASSLRV